MLITDLKKGMKIIGIIPNITYYVRKVEEHRVYINLYRSTLGCYITNEDINWIATAKINDFKENNMKGVNLNVERMEERLSKSIISRLEKIIKSEEAITLLQSLGYKIESPYIPPTDEEIIARIKSDNNKIEYVADWNDASIPKYNIYCLGCEIFAVGTRWSERSIGITYTSKEIAEKMCDELNSKSFMRV